MKFDKNGIAKVPKESRMSGISLGLVSSYIGASIGLALGAGILGNTLLGIDKK